MPLASRSPLGPYEILARIGAGGVARGTHLDRMAALKDSRGPIQGAFRARGGRHRRAKAQHGAALRLLQFVIGHQGTHSTLCPLKDVQEHGQTDTRQQINKRGHQFHRRNQPTRNVQDGADEIYCQEGCEDHHRDQDKSAAFFRFSPRTGSPAIQSLNGIAAMRARNQYVTKPGGAFTRMRA